MIDIANARALVETLKDYAEHPSSFTDISPTEADAAADLIDALLNEVERLNSPVVLSEWQKLVAERDALAREVDACAAALPGPYYMDPPDGGDVSISEQLRRMARDAARYRWLRQPNPLHREAHIAVLTHNGGWVASEEKADAAIDAAMKGASDD